jgi:predicted small metal-binding protein
LYISSSQAEYYGLTVRTKRELTRQSRVNKLNAVIGGSTMAKTLCCRDVGPDCDFVARGETEEEIMLQVAQHARDAHGLEEVPAELADKARAAIREAQSA